MRRAATRGAPRQVRTRRETLHVVEPKLRLVNVRLVNEVFHLGDGVGPHLVRGVPRIERVLRLPRLILPEVLAPRREARQFVPDSTLVPYQFGLV